MHSSRYNSQLKVTSCEVLRLGKYAFCMKTISIARSFVLVICELGIKSDMHGEKNPQPFLLLYITFKEKHMYTNTVLLVML